MAARGTAARVWVLTSGKTGDDKQPLRLANALGVPFEEKKIVFNDRAASWRLMFGASLTSVDLARSAALEAPWPEMVISVGWRQVPVVRWIRDQAPGRVRLVQMNRPPGPKHFDLILAPPQFEVPVRSNIVRLDWPLQLPPDPERLVAAEIQWRERLAHLPHPWTVLLLGGASYPFLLDAATSERLMQQAIQRVGETGGALLVSTSRRTPAEAIASLRKACASAEVPVHLYSWAAGSAGDAGRTENPYLAYLAGGDEFVVTPDSISMLVEVARLGRPLSIAPHTRFRALDKDLRDAAKRWLHGSRKRTRGPLGEAISDLASTLGLKYGRDLASVSRNMIELGWAAEFPNFGGRSGEHLPDDDFPRIVERTRALLGDD